MSVLGTAPWRRAPLPLRRSPAVLLTAEEARWAGLGAATAWPAGRDLLAARELTERAP